MSVQTKHEALSKTVELWHDIQTCTYKMQNTTLITTSHWADYCSDNGRIWSGLSDNLTKIL
jgi:hypothetical protein